MQANTFMILPSYIQAVGELPAKDRGEMWRAIIEYATQGVQPALRLSSQRAIFAAIKPSLDYNMSRRKPHNAGIVQAECEHHSSGMQTSCEHEVGTPSIEKGNKKGEEEKERSKREKESARDVIPMPVWQAAEDKPVAAWFSRLWSLYPKKEGCYRAQAALSEIAWQLTEADVERMEAIIKRKAASEDWIKENGRFVPMFAKWLAGRPWMDGPPEKTASKTLSPQEKAAIDELLRE